MAQMIKGMYTQASVQLRAETCINGIYVDSPLVNYSKHVHAYHFYTFHGINGSQKRTLKAYIQYSYISIRLYYIKKQITSHFR
jgi:hypothetical protein